MEEKVKVFGYVVAMFAVVAIAFMGFGGWLGYQRGYAKARMECEAKTDTVTVTDTIVFNRFHTDTVVRTERVPFHTAVHDTIVDSVLVYLPMEWHHAHIEDTADVWYHGVMAAIDSMRFYSATRIVTTEKTVYKEPRLTANLGCAAMYSESRVNPCLFSEVRWNQPKATFSAVASVNHEGKWGIGGSVSYRINLMN